ncbi:hypothetical protein [Actinomadura sp. SCN-SB]|uniref:hypothetical protein n=1 Tax=Actinomadura sp. SCN-SB TaxID=3373092 RepID=UPI003750BC0B
MRGDEARVVDAFCRYLRVHGWTVEREQAFCDVVAKRDGQTLYAEAKGRTSSPGLDVDTLYGQLLRRIPDTADGTEILGVVVPTLAVSAALRVGVRVRELLGIHVFEVTDDDVVRHHADFAQNPLTS